VNTAPEPAHPFPAALAEGLARRRLPGLDGLRAIAAYLVVFFHFELPWVPGGLGVLMFFVLSGFLITWLLLDEIGRHGTVSLRGFYLRRTLRIVPAFYVYTGGLLVMLLVFGRPIVWGQAIASLLYVNNYYQALLGDPNTGLSHTWSLAIEEQFYLLWPIAFVALYRHGRLARGLVVAIVCVAFDTRADHLMVGCLLAVSLRDGFGARLWHALCSHVALPALTLAALALSSALNVRIAGYRDVAGAVIEPLLVAALIVQLIAFANARAWRWTDWPAVRYLGRISYSVYLYQQLVPTLVEATLGGQPFALRLAAHVTGVTLAASVSYWAVERPFLALKERWAHPASTGRSRASHWSASPLR
jgi:peptidoglycan/LPS O-acetylase OafA/YrhL